MFAAQIAYIAAKAAVVVAQNEMESQPFPEMNASVAEWDAADALSDEIATRVQIDAKWQAVRDAEKALLDWGYKTVLRQVKTVEQKSALETMYATTNVNARKNLISLIMKLEA